jgi:uncharacterized membrane protein
MGCYFRALKVGDASKVAPVDKLSLLLVALFAVLFLSNDQSPGSGWEFFSLEQASSSLL